MCNQRGAVMSETVDNTNTTELLLYCIYLVDDADARPISNS